MKLMRNAGLLALYVLVTACAQAPTKQDETIFYPPLPQTPRIQFLTGFTTENEFAGRSSQLRSFLVGDEEQASAALARPFSIAHRPGQVLIADKTYRKVLVLDLEQKTMDYLEDTQVGRLGDPVGVFVAANGELFVADAARNRVFVFDRGNRFLRSYGEDGQFRPMDVVVEKDRVYVCDINQSEIEVLDRATGEVIDTVGGIGSEEGFLNKPTHLALDTGGNLFVTDAFNLRLQMFDPDGDFVKVIGWNVRGPGGLARPKGLDVDRDGHLYIGDAAFQVMQVFSVETRDALLNFGKSGSGPGGNYMPSDVHIDYDNVSYFQEFAHPNFELEYLIYVGNLLGDKKLNVYGFGHWTG